MWLELLIVWHGGQKRRVWAPCSESHSSNSASLSKGQAVRLFLIFPWMPLVITSATLNQNSQQPVFMSSQRPHFSLLRAANMSQFCFVFWPLPLAVIKHTPRASWRHFFCYCCFVSCMQVFFVATLCSYIKDFFLASLLMVFTIRFFAINLNFLELTQCSLS